MLENTLARVESDCKQYSAVIAVVPRSFRTANAEASAARKYGNVTERCYLSPTINCACEEREIEFPFNARLKKKKRGKKRKKRYRLVGEKKKTLEETDR